MKKIFVFFTTILFSLSLFAQTKSSALGESAKTVKVGYLISDSNFMSGAGINEQKDGYAYSTSRIDGRKIFYHVLFKKDENMVIDHVNGDRTDNRLRNLREVTSSENSQNLHLLWKDKRKTSKFPGVYWNKKRECWICQARKHKANHPNSIHVKKEGFKTEYEAFDYYIAILKGMGRTINTETEQYKDYLKWKGEQQQVTLDVF